MPIRKRMTVRNPRTKLKEGEGESMSFEKATEKKMKAGELVYGMRREDNQHADTLAIVKYAGILYRHSHTNPRPAKFGLGGKKAAWRVFKLKSMGMEPLPNEMEREIL